MSNFRAAAGFFKHHLQKRDSIFNFGGYDGSQSIEGNSNHVLANTQSPTNVGKETLLRKTGHEIGRLLEGGTDLATAPVRWLQQMQENWPIYLVCITILVICGMASYCCIRQKLSALTVTNDDIVKIRNVANHQYKKPRIEYSDNIFEI